MTCPGTRRCFRPNGSAVQRESEVVSIRVFDSLNRCPQLIQLPASPLIAPTADPNLYAVRLSRVGSPISEDMFSSRILASNKATARGPSRCASRSRSSATVRSSLKAGKKSSGTPLPMLTEGKYLRRFARSEMMFAI